MALLAVVLLPASGWASSRVVDYLYIEANEDGSSGGHAGLRVGDDVFHFEYRRPGLLVLRRETFAEFRRHYAGLENRTIEMRRIPVSGETYQRVHDRFSRRYLIQQQHLEALDTLRADQRILEEIRRGSVALDGAGFFDTESGDPTLLALRERVLRVHGASFLTDRIEAIRRYLASLDPQVGQSPKIEVAHNEMSAPAYEFPQRYRDALTALAALETLATARPLLPEATMTSGAEELRLREDEALMLPRLSDALAASLVRLVASRRPDWGFPLLLGMARLAALDRTRESGRWVFLDAFPSPGTGIEPARVPRRPEVMTALLRDAQAELKAARVRLVSRPLDEGAFDEGAFADLEDAGNRFARMRRARDEGRDVYVPHHLPPSTRHGVYPAVHAPSSTAIAVSLAAVVEREQAYAGALERLYRYHLITRNCVSELVREIDAALPGDRVVMARGLHFIPALSALMVSARYGASEVVRVPSQRRAGLARLYEKESPLRVFLRESNTITSTLYRGHPRDSVFLFFTDDVVVTRPIFGAVNLITGLAASGAGLVTLPFDDGRMLRAGVRGAVFSLPELFFQNIRKGSFEYVERAADEVPTTVDPSP